MSSDRFVVIPTRLDRHTLLPLVESALEVAQVVIVHTEPGHDPIPGTITLYDDSLSIQHWWNTGLDVCTGPTLVLNDDIVAAPSELVALFDALDSADLVYLSGHRLGHFTPLTGWCYGLYPHMLRPSNDFGWWGGDDDLYLRATHSNLRVTAVDVPGIRHERVEAAFANPSHAAMVEADMNLLHSRWG
jgi:hypothetical protein